MAETAPSKSTLLLKHLLPGSFQAGWMVFIVLLLNTLPAQAADRTYCLNVNYSAVPAMVNSRKLTLSVNVGTCSSVTVTADGVGIPSTYNAGNGTALFTTTGSAIQVTAVNWTAGGTGAATKTTLYNNLKWAFSLTLDDGLQSQVTNAKPLLDAKGWKAGAAVVGNWANTGGANNYMSWATVQSLRTAGWEIYNHSYTHPNPMNCGNFQTELDQNETQFNNRLAGYNVNHLVYPYEVSTATGCGGFPPSYIISGEVAGGLNFVDVALPNVFLAGRSGLYGTDPNPLQTAAANAAANARPAWMIVITHGVSAGGGAPPDAYATNANTLSTLLNYLDTNFGSGGSRNMWFAPSGEVMDYLFTRDRATVVVCTPAVTSTPTRTNTPLAPTATRTSTLTATPTRTATPLAATATSSATRTSSATASRTATPSSTSTPTSTATRTNSPTSTASASPTPSRTNTPPLATLTPTNSSSPTATPSATRTSTSTPSRTATASSTNTLPPNTATQTSISTSTRTSTPTSTASNSRTATPSATSSATPSPSLTRTSTSTPVPPTLTSTTSSTASPTRTATLTQSPTATDTGAPTASRTSTPSSTLTTTGTATSTLSMTRTASATASRTPTASSTSSGTPSASATNTSSSTSSPTATDTGVPSATASSSPTPTPSPSMTATASLTASRTASLTATPSPTPSASNTAVPTSSSTRTASPTATTSQTNSPTPTPSWTPSRTTTSTLTRTMTPTSTASLSSTATASPTPTSSATNSATVTVSDTPTPTATSTATFPPTVTPTATMPTGPSPIVFPNPVPTGWVDVLPQTHATASDLMVQVHTSAFKPVLTKGFPMVQSGATVRIDLVDDRGQELANGVYYVTVIIGRDKKTTTLIVAR